MLGSLVRHLRGNLVAYLALFAALGGTSVAAATALVPKNSVGSAQVINGSLQRVDFNKKAIAKLRGRRGPEGPMGLMGRTGPTGAQGVQGPKGDTGPSNAFENGFCATAAFPDCTQNPVAITQSTPLNAPFFLTMNLPPGSFIVSTEVMVVADDSVNPPDWRVSCEVRTPLAGPGFSGGAAATVGDANGDASETTMPIVFGTTLPSGGTAGIRCWRTDGSGATGTGANPNATYVDMTAVRVGSLNGPG